MDSRSRAIGRARRLRGTIATIMLAGLVAVTTAGCRGPGKSLDVGAETEFAMRSARAGLWNEALYRWERVVIVRPDDPRIHNNLGVAYEHEGRYEDARREYRKALDLAPGDDRVQKNYEAFENFFGGQKKTGEGDGAASEGPPTAPEAPEIEREGNGKS